MATNYKLQDYAHLSGKDVFVDANVLIYLFWSTGDYFYETNYARAFNNLRKQGNNLYVDFLVISEVVNRVLRIEHQKLNANQKFKDFRNSQDGKDVINDIYLIVQNYILGSFKIIGKSFNKSDIEGFLIVDQLDFVDKATVSICSENNFVLLTNDRDFKNCGLDILTGNPHILN
ncbi:MAG: type II toxin-antitoxin system VapC family toxin [Chitinophagaceae bacterium]|nr:type II toxin-antitoxin system VapC family toxin [Chitinophagaceae bacterium]